MRHGTTSHPGDVMTSGGSAEQVAEQSYGAGSAHPALDERRLRRDALLLSIAVARDRRRRRAVRRA